MRFVNNTLHLLSLFIAFLFINCGNKHKEEYYVKYVAFPSHATLEEKLDIASRLVPTPQQLAWQEMELTAFLHFGINTFTGREWGDGKESPSLFNPTELNAEQWVKTLKEAGFKMAILTAKHHDGFCLWPTKTTSHSVTSSPWKNGEGDVVKELRDACEKYGLKFGVYLSPWDRNAGCYGDSPRYNEFFIRQLTELLTNYGEIHEVWFDGACGEGPNGKKQEYDWNAFYETIKQLQPNAVMAIMGDDVRWVGNEKGLGRETEWNATALTPGIYERSAEQNKQLGIHAKAPDLGGRDILSKANELFWYPSEVDVSIRPGWFYHAAQDNQVKSLAQLTDIYFRSVGYNSVLLLNIPPDRRGLIHENDAARLKEFSEYLSRTFSEDKTKGTHHVWKAESGDWKEFEQFDKGKINTLLLQEDISKGQRVESFIIEVLSNGQWEKVYEGTTIGYKRLVRFPEKRADKIKVTIAQCRRTAHLSNVASYYAEPIREETSELNLTDVSKEGWDILSTAPLTIDMGEINEITGFTYAPLNEYKNLVYTYNFYISDDGKEWEACIRDGEFSNIMHNPIPQFVYFGIRHKARYFKFEILKGVEEEGTITQEEIGILTR